MADSNDDDDFMKSLEDFVGESDGNTTNQEYNEVDLVSFVEAETTRNEAESTKDEAETTAVSNGESKEEKKLAEFDKNYFKPPKLWHVFHPPPPILSSSVLLHDCSSSSSSFSPLRKIFYWEMFNVQNS